MSFFIVEPPSQNTPLHFDTVAEAIAWIVAERDAGGDVSGWAVCHFEGDKLIVDYRPEVSR